jgi:hypothetical protein
LRGFSEVRGKKRRAGSEPPALLFVGRCSWRLVHEPLAVHEAVFAVPLLLAPELGLPLLLFGLRLLALEFDWAVRLYVRVEKLGRRLFGLLKRLYKSMFKSKRRIAVTVLIWAVVTVAVWMLVW